MSFLQQRVRYRVSISKDILRLCIGIQFHYSGSNTIYKCQCLYVNARIASSSFRIYDSYKCHWTEQMLVEVKAWSLFESIDQLNKWDTVDQQRERYTCTHYGNVITSALPSQSPLSRVFAQPFVQVQIAENIKAPRHWPLWGEFTARGDVIFVIWTTDGTCVLVVWWNWSLLANEIATW